MQRPLSRTEELLEVLSQEGEPLVAQWARGARGRIRDTQDLLLEVSQMEAEGGPVARSLVATLRASWQEFGGPPLPSIGALRNQGRLPLR